VGIHLSLFCNWGPKRCFHKGEYKVPKTIDEGPLNVAFSKKKNVKKL
jgi:hypothetical protein